MELSKEGIELIKRFEGLQKWAYIDQAGIWTIGIGHVILPRDLRNGTQVPTFPDQLRWSEEQCVEEFLRDAHRFEVGVTSALAHHGVKATQWQFDALVSFTFNLGLGVLAAPSVFAAVGRLPKTAALEASFTKYIYAGGKRSRGLESRRAAEIRHAKRKD